MDMSKIDYATARPLGTTGSLALACGTAVAILAAPVLLVWVIGETLVRDLRRVGRGLRAVGEEVLRAARD